NGYKNKFDVVLLERPQSNTLNMPWTIWNASHMLKVGGELVIDSCEDCRSELYTQKGIESPFYRICVKSEQKEKQPFNSEHNKNLDKYLLSDRKITVNHDMDGMVDYLQRWFFNEIINLKDGKSLYRSERGAVTRILS